MPLSFAPPTDTAIPIRLVEKSEAQDVLSGLPQHDATWVAHHGFKGALGQSCAIPGGDGRPGLVLLGMGDASDRARTRFGIGAAISKLPEADYVIEAWPEGPIGPEIALGYLFSLYRFSRYRTQTPPRARLVPPAHLDAARLERIATGEALTRDLINTPAEDMGPRELEHAAHDLAELHGATVRGIHGESLLDANLPLIHTVGRASDEDPRLIDMTWGEGSRPASDACRQGRVFRHRWAEPETRRLHGPDEEGHGRCGHSAGPCAHDHGQRGCRSVCAC
jgi:leucyl aminopeptidase